VLEFVSGDGSEERDRTPLLRSAQQETKPGKFWIYENVIRPAFYGIYEVSRSRVQVYHLIEGQYQLVPQNERGHYPIPVLEVELGIWQGRYQNAELPWLRWWDSEGNLLLAGEERAEQERQRAEQERQRAELAEQQLEQLRVQLRAAGIEPQV
jgi:Putative restriction endonuclease